MDIKNLKIENPDKLLEQLSINDVTPNIVKIAKASNITTNIAVLTDSNGNETGINGYAFIGEGDYIKKREILISSKLSPSGRRFLIAYFLGAYHLQDNIDEPLMEIIYEESIYDKKYYNYALDLLIPNQEFNKENISNPNYEYLENKYNVSRCLIEEKIKRKKINKKFEVIK